MAKTEKTNKTEEQAVTEELFTIKLLKNVKYGNTPYKIGDIIKVKEDEMDHIVKQKIGVLTKEPKDEE